jgi:hypothetical protein
MRTRFKRTHACFDGGIVLRPVRRRQELNDPIFMEQLCKPQVAPIGAQRLSGATYGTDGGRRARLRRVGRAAPRLRFWLVFYEWAGGVWGCGAQSAYFVRGSLAASGSLGEKNFLRIRL